VEMLYDAPKMKASEKSVSAAHAREKGDHAQRTMPADE